MSQIFLNKCLHPCLVESSRLYASFPNISQISTFIERLWESIVVRLLFSVFPLSSLAVTKTVREDIQGPLTELVVLFPPKSRIQIKFYDGERNQYKIRQERH